MVVEGEVAVDEAVKEQETSRFLVEEFLLTWLPEDGEEALAWAVSIEVMARILAYHGLGVAGTGTKRVLDV